MQEMLAHLKKSNLYSENSEQKRGNKGMIISASPILICQNFQKMNGSNLMCQNGKHKFSGRGNNETDSKMRPKTTKKKARHWKKAGKKGS